MLYIIFALFAIWILGRPKYKKIVLSEAERKEESEKMRIWARDIDRQRMARIARLPPEVAEMPTTNADEIIALRAMQQELRKEIQNRPQVIERHLHVYVKK